MKILIVDDEPLARERLRQMLHEFDDIEVSAIAATGRQAVEKVAQSSPDVVLMDIRMPGMDGLEAANHMASIEEPPAIIFCTAYDEHALDAFNAYALDYLVKPIRPERLAQALKKAKRFNREGVAAVAEEHSSSTGRTHLCARVRGNLELVPIEEVIYLHAEHKYVTVKHERGEVLIEESLTNLEEEFEERFLRIHRNALVAIDRLAGLEKDDDDTVEIVMRGTDDKLAVSRRNLPKVRKLLKNL